MTIYSELVKPIADLDRQIEVILEHDKISGTMMLRLRSLIIRKCELDLALSIANMTTSCSNGQTILENLLHQKAIRSSANIAGRYGFNSLLEKWGAEADGLRKIINNANSKETKC